MALKIIFTSVVYVLCGTTTTLLFSYTNTLESEGRNGTVTIFRHPFLQTWGLSVGEFGCLFIFFLWNSVKDHPLDKDIDEATKPKTQKFSAFIFLPASIMHVTFRCFIFLSLTFTTPGSYQMLAGTILVFTCILSRIFLKRILSWIKWLGVLIIVIGVVVVGLSDMLLKEMSDDAQNSTLGDIFAVFANLFGAMQATYEEKYIKKYNIKPLNVVGLKGTFSLIILSFMLVGFYYLKVPFEMGQLDGQMEDAIDGFIQLGNSPILLVSYICTTICLCIFMTSGIMITKKLSAVHRIVIGQLRAIFVWAVSISAPAFNEEFQPLQIVGFLIISLGVLVFNDILIGPFIRGLLKKIGLIDSKSSSIKITSTTGQDNKVFEHVLDVELKSVKVLNGNLLQNVLPNKILVQSTR